MGRSKQNNNARKKLFSLSNQIRRLVHQLGENEGKKEILENIQKLYNEMLDHIKEENSPYWFKDFLKDVDLPNILADEHCVLKNQISNTDHCQIFGTTSSEEYSNNLCKNFKATDRPCTFKDFSSDTIMEWSDAPKQEHLSPISSTDIKLNHRASLEDDCHTSLLCDEDNPIPVITEDHSNYTPSEKSLGGECGVSKGEEIQKSKSKKITVNKKANIFTLKDDETKNCYDFDSVDEIYEWYVPSPMKEEKDEDFLPDLEYSSDSTNLQPEPVANLQLHETSDSEDYLTFDISWLNETRQTDLIQNFSVTPESPCTAGTVKATFKNWDKSTVIDSKDIDLNFGTDNPKTNNNIPIRQKNKKRISVIENNIFHRSSLPIMKKNKQSSSTPEIITLDDDDCDSYYGDKSYFVGPYNISVQDTLCIISNQYKERLNDDTVDAFIYLLCVHANRNSQSVGAVPTSYNNVVFKTNSDERKGDNIFNGFLKWARDTELGSKEIIIFPIHYPHHYKLIIVNSIEREVTALDSLGYYDRGTVFQVTDYHAAIGLWYEMQPEIDEKKEEMKWRVKLYDHKFQNDCISCGVYICYWTYLVCTGMAKKNPPHNDVTMVNFRKTMNEIFNDYQEAYFKSKAKKTCSETNLMQYFRVKGKFSVPKVSRSQVIVKKIADKDTVNDLNNTLAKYCTFDQPSRPKFDDFGPGF